MCVRSSQLSRASFEQSAGARTLCTHEAHGDVYHTVFGEGQRLQGAMSGRAGPCWFERLTKMNVNVPLMLGKTKISLASRMLVSVLEGTL